MKTKEYVTKYNLSQSDKFNHNEFVSDLANDLLTALEVGKGKENIKGFNNAVNAIKMKFDAINNKTLGNIEKIWGYFFATVVVKLKEELFPEFVKAQNEQREKAKRQYEERKRFEDSYDDFFFWGRMAGLLNLIKSPTPTSSFAVLGLSVDAKEDEVKSAFRKLSLQHHPDKGGNAEKFTEIVEAKNKVMAYLSK
jgi:hypothetical protein